MPNETSNSTAIPTTGSMAQEVFLTPRVVDAATFASFSATLRELLADADDRRQSLSTLNGEVAALRDALRALTTELESKLMTAVKVIPAIDQRLSKVNDALTFAEAVVRSHATERKQGSESGATPTDQQQSTPTTPTAPIAQTAPASIHTAADHAAVTASIARHAEERLAQVLADARGELDATTQVHLASVLHARDEAEDRLHQHALGLEHDSRSRLEGVLLEGLTHAATSKATELGEQLQHQLSTQLETKLAAKLDELVQQRVDAAVAAALAQQMATTVPTQVAALVRENMNALPSREPDPAIARVQQQIDELAQWTKRVDALLNDHSGLVAAQSAHSALAQIATQAAGLGQHLEALTRRAEMTAHTLAGLMSQLPMANHPIAMTNVQPAHATTMPHLGQSLPGTREQHR